MTPRVEPMLPPPSKPRPVDVPQLWRAVGEALDLDVAARRLAAQQLVSAGNPHGALTEVRVRRQELLATLEGLVDALRDAPAADRMYALTLQGGVTKWQYGCDRQAEVADDARERAASWRGERTTAPGAEPVEASHAP